MKMTGRVTRSRRSRTVSNQKSLSREADDPEVKGK